MSINNNRKVPQNIEAEEALLGAILFDPDSFKEIESKIKAKMFSIRKHQLIYVAISNLNKEEIKPNLINVSTFLADKDLLETVGGMPYLSKLANRTISSENCDRYAELIFDKWKRRELIKLGHELVNLGHENAIDLPDLTNQVRSELDSWIGSDQEDQENNLIGTMSYTAISHQHGEHYDETIRLEAEINLNSDPQAQIKKLQKQAESFLKPNPS